MAKETIKSPKDVRDNGPEQVKDGIYNGPAVRVVTMEDIMGDPRVVAAGAVAGQLFDFSNLVHVKDNALENDVDRANQAHVNVGITEEDPLGEEKKKDQQAPSETSVFERKEMGIENPEDVPPRY